MRKTMMVDDIRDMVRLTNKNVDWCAYMFKKHGQSIRRLAIAGIVIGLYFDAKTANLNKKIDELSRQINELRERNGKKSD